MQTAPKFTVAYRSTTGRTFYFFEGNLGRGPVRCWHRAKHAAKQFPSREDAVEFAAFAKSSGWMHDCHEVLIAQVAA